MSPLLHTKSALLYNTSNQNREIDDPIKRSLKEIGDKNGSPFKKRDRK
jgi:hypothetical protein